MANLFEKNLDEFSRKFLVKNTSGAEPKPIEFISSLRRSERELFENLILFDKISYKVSGENIPLAVIISRLGVKKTEELIEQEAIEFLLWDQQILHFVNDNPGVNPLVTSSLREGPLKDPETSIKTGLQWLKKPIRKSDERNIIRKVSDIYRYPHSDLSRDMASFCNSAFESGKLEFFGLSPRRTSLRHMNIKERNKLNECAVKMMEYANMLEQGLTSYSDIGLYHLFDDSRKNIASAPKIKENYNEISQMECLPDLREIYSFIENPYEEIIKIRNKKSSEKLRRWLSEKSVPGESTEISKEYLDAISKVSKSNTNTSKRLTKTVALSAVSTIAGTLVAGPYGGAVGFSAGLGGSLGVDLLDEFLLKKISRNWSPRVFFDDIRKLENR